MADLCKHAMVAIARHFIPEDFLQESTGTELGDEASGFLCPGACGQSTAAQVQQNTALPTDLIQSKTFLGEEL